MSLIPGIDLVRLLMLFSPLSDAIPSLLETISDTSGTVKEQETNSMLAFRALANTFKTASGKALMVESASDVRWVPSSFRAGDADPLALRNG